ncbi:MAG: hypothetical protein ACRDVE_03000 [Actinocrinis sp.]
MTGPPKTSKRPKRGAPDSAQPEPPKPAGYVSLDEILTLHAPASVIRAREMWECRHPVEGGRAMPYQEIADQYGVSVHRVRQQIAAEERRQELEARAATVGG